VRNTSGWDMSLRSLFYPEASGFPSSVWVAVIFHCPHKYVHFRTKWNPCWRLKGKYVGWYPKWGFPGCIFFEIMLPLKMGKVQNGVECKSMAARAFIKRGLFSVRPPSTHLENRGGKSTFHFRCKFVETAIFLNAGCFFLSVTVCCWSVAFCNILSILQLLLSSIHRDVPSAHLSTRVQVGESPCFFSPWLLFPVWMRKTGLKLSLHKEKSPPQFSPQRFYTIHY